MFRNHFCALTRSWIVVTQFMFVVLLLAGCGGGGGGGGGGSSPPTTPVASTKSFPIEVAIANMVKNGLDAPFQFTGTYTPAGQTTSYPVTGQGTYSWVPAVNATFQGIQVLDAAAVANGSETVNGNSSSVNSIQHQYFRSDNYYPVGQIDDSNAFYVVTSFTSWPTAAKVGDSGTLGAVTIYADYTLASITGNQQWTYTVEPDTADTVIFVWAIAETDSDGTKSTQLDRYRITSTGGITYVSTTYSSSYAGDASSLTLTPTSVKTPGNTPAPAPWSPVGLSNNPISGSIIGQITSNLILVNGTDSVIVAAGSTYGAYYFAFPTQLSNGTTYNVTVLAQPSGQTCSVLNGSGTKGNLSVTNVVVSCVTSTIVSTLAGTGQAGAANGPGNTASFSTPQGVAVDAAGNVYVADRMNNMIRKITPDGIVSTVAGTGQIGSANGPGNTATFNSPMGIAVDSAGYIYVADIMNNMIRKVTPDGVVSTLAGTGQQGSANGPGNTASFNLPKGVAVDTAGNVYVADGGNNMIRKITPAGVVSTLAGTGQIGSTDGPGISASFSNPYGVAVDGVGIVYVGDYGNYSVRKIASDGTVSTFAGGLGSSQSFNTPTGVAVDSKGYVYMAELFNHRIDQIAPNSAVVVIAGYTNGSTGSPVGSTDGPGGTARFGNPVGVAVDSAGNVYVADQAGNTIRKIVFQ